MQPLGLQDGRQAHHRGQRLQFLRQLPLVQIEICEIRLQAKFLIIYQHIQAGLLSKEKAIPNHAFSDLQHGQTQPGAMSLKGLSLDSQQASCCCWRASGNASSQALRVSTETRSLNHISANIRTNMAKKHKAPSPQKRQNAKWRGRKRKFLALSGKVETIQYLGHKHPSGQLWKD